MTNTFYIDSNGGEVSKDTVADYLAFLRDSGVTNMFGAGPYLESEFNFDRRTARKALGDWMDSFKG